MKDASLYEQPIAQSSVQAVVSWVTEKQSGKQYVEWEESVSTHTCFECG